MPKDDECERGKSCIYEDVVDVCSECLLFDKFTPYDWFPEVDWIPEIDCENQEGVKGENMAEVLFWIISCDECGLFVADDIQVDMDDDGNLICPKCKKVNIVAKAICRAELASFSINSLLAIQRNIISLSERKISEMI